MTTTRENSRGVPTAHEFIFESFRGLYLLGRIKHAGSLQNLITVLEAVPLPYKEVSDIGDLKYIQENIWEFTPTLIAEKLDNPDFCLGDYHVVRDCETDETCQCGEIYT